ncbi:MAG: hypothetical protein CL678_14835 [Bdellovibrionaceae bacterium]|nr:hypothetical protein [Pseudobdellovibrionaceae bacterium]|tara:strand:+ start:2731 stop:3477 length:747 start_codon:yes stop_codon:yes gene_type:complete
MKYIKRLIETCLFILAVHLIFHSITAEAAEKKEQKNQSEEVNVDKIKKKYWTSGKTQDFGVVQNRIYSKSGKIAVGVMGGFLTSDPFLSTKTLGLNIGYHFNEYLSLSVLGWKSFVSNSSALDSFESFSGATANTNLTRYYAGTQFDYSFLYGKLSLLGLKIIHFDLNVGAGLGATGTETGTYITPSLAVGQRYYLTKLISLRLDYRFMYYRERLVEKVVPQSLGQDRGTRNNLTHSITLGVDFMFEL